MDSARAGSAWFKLKLKPCLCSCGRLTRGLEECNHPSTDGRVDELFCRHKINITERRYRVAAR